MLAASWTPLRHDKAPGRRVLDQDHPDSPYYSGKHKRHGMSIQVLVDPFGRLLWASPALPGSTHDLYAADTTESSTRSPRRGSSVGRTRGIKAPAGLFESRSAVAV